MAKAFDFLWRVPVPDHLLKGAIFDRWDEVGAKNCNSKYFNNWIQILYPLRLSISLLHSLVPTLVSISPFDWKLETKMQLFHNFTQNAWKDGILLIGRGRFWGTEQLAPDKDFDKLGIYPPYFCSIG